MLLHLSYLQVLAGALTVVLAVVLALVARAHSRRVRAGAPGGHSYGRNSASDLQSGSFSELEEWLIDNRSRLLEFKVQNPASQRASGAPSKKDENRNWD